MEKSSGGARKESPPQAIPGTGESKTARGKITSVSVVIWVVVVALGVLFSIIAVLIGLQASQLTLMSLFVAILFDAPLAAGIIVLLWYGRTLKRATTARTATANALAQSEAKFRELIAAAPDGIFALDAQATVLDVNEAGEALLGRDRQDIVGRSFMDFVPADRVPVARAYLADRLKGLRATELYEAIFIAAAGNPVHVQLRSQVVRPADADPYLVYIARDVTGQMETQRKLLETERWASMGRLASFVAHEINTPLTNISLLTASVARRTTDPDVQERLKKISMQGKIAANITAELLKFARAGAINPVETDLTEIVEAAVEQAEAFRKPGTRLKTDLGDRPVVRSVDPMRIQEVVVNLIKNAYEATPKGTVTVRLEERGDLAAIAVSDTGTGIPPEIQARLFEAFFTTKKKGEGTGLGLAISRSFVVNHGGDITVSSEVNKGATFTVLLPKELPSVRASG
jgi:PAS domain S-box-containing protein